MKTQFTLLVILLSLAQVAKAQPYQSMFANGDGETRWLIIWNNLWGWSTDTVVAEKDTMVNGFSYKKIAIEKLPNIIDRGLMREDMNTGKVWYWDIADSVERLAFDFSLDVGDTFDISHFVESCNFNYRWHNYPDSFNVVDSVRYINDLKYIYFKGHYEFYMLTNNGQYVLNDYEPFTFIEGVGSNAGILWRQPVPNLMAGQYLLCSYKSGQKTSFVNRFYNGQCFIPTDIETLQIEGSTITIYPNPSSGQVNIRNSTNDKINKIQIISQTGQLVKEVTFLEITSVEIEEIPAGYYYLKLYTGNGYVTVKPMVVR